MPVTDEQTAALRAFLWFDPSSERLTRDLADAGRLDGFGALAHAAFVIAVRRRFAPTWTSAQIVGFTARLRNALRPQGIDLDPRATEILIRQALGDPVTSDHDDKTQARATTLMLIELTADEQLDDDGLDALMAEARALADTRLATRHIGGPNRSKQFGPVDSRIREALPPRAANTSFGGAGRGRRGYPRCSGRMRTQRRFRLGLETRHCPTAA